IAPEVTPALQISEPDITADDVRTLSYTFTRLGLDGRLQSQSVRRIVGQAMAEAIIEFQKVGGEPLETTLDALSPSTLSQTQYAISRSNLASGEQSFARSALANTLLSHENYLYK